LRADLHAELGAASSLEQDIAISTAQGCIARVFARYGVLA